MALPRRYARLPRLGCATQPQLRARRTGNFLEKCSAFQPRLPQPVLRKCAIHGRFLWKCLGLGERKNRESVRTRTGNFLAQNREFFEALAPTATLPIEWFWSRPSLHGNSGPQVPKRPAILPPGRSGKARLAGMVVRRLGGQRLKVQNVSRTRRAARARGYSRRLVAPGSAASSGRET